MKWIETFSWGEYKREEVCEKDDLIYAQEKITSYIELIENKNVTENEILFTRFREIKEDGTWFICNEIPFPIKFCATAIIKDGFLDSLKRAEHALKNDCVDTELVSLSILPITQ